MSNFNHNSPKYSGKYIAGFILMAVGLILLFRQFDLFFFPSWLFSWPMILIIVGLVQRGRHRSKNSTWLILVVTGCLFLADEIFPGTNVFRLGWPVIFVAIGLWLILSRKQEVKNPESFSKEAFVNDDFLNPEPVSAEQQTTTPPQTEGTEDYLNSFSIFGDVKKSVMSKSFKGGEIVNIFAGTHLDFSYSNIGGRVVIDVVQLFGGTKLVVPPHWQVVSDIAPIFGGVSDKRVPHADVATSGKVLVLKGVSIFGGVDIKSY